MEILKKIEKSYLFKDIDRKYLAEIAENSRIRAFRQDEFVFFEGDSGDHFYIVLEGRIELYKSSSDDREVVLKTVGKDESFAEVILFEQNTYPVTAKSNSDSKLLCIEKERIIGMLAIPEFRNQFIRTLFSKMRDLTERLKFLNSMDVEERFLCYLKMKFGKQSRYELNQSKKDIAREIGTIPETMSRMIKKLSSRGVEWKGTKLTFPEDFWNSHE